jgi:pyrimidine and pyridine-specific 5'-nucleotidase
MKFILTHPLDDSALNCKKAEELGWTTVHLVEEGVHPPAAKPCQYQIKHLDELRALFPQFFSGSKKTT